MKDLTSGNIYKTFIVFAIPLILSGLFSMLTGTIDTMMIGSFLGENQVAAVSATSSFLRILPKSNLKIHNAKTIIIVKSA